MKRFFFSLIALSAAVVGCTQSAMLESPEIFNQEVSFSPYTGRTPVTKATDIVGKTGLASAGGFQVYCFLDKKNSSPLVTYIDDAHVTSNDGETWSYNKLVYWPDATSQSTLSFVAYSSNAVNHGLSDLTTSGFTFTVPKDVDEQVDLLATAYYKGHNLKNTSSGKVTLNFQHLLSRVGFKVLTTTDKSVIINALSFGGTLANVGTLDFDAQVINAGTTESAIPALNVSTQKATNEYYEFLVDDSAAQSKDDVTISNANQTAVQITRANNSNYLMIMPQTVAAQGDVAINVTYTISGSSKSKSAKVELPAGFEFAAGMAYEFVLNISTSSIKFTVEQSDWGDEQSSEHPVIPDDANKVKAVVTTGDLVTNAGTKVAPTTFYLTPIANAPELSTIGFKYTSAPDDIATITWANVTTGESYTEYTKNKTIPSEKLSLNPSTTYAYCTYWEEDGEVIYSDTRVFTTKVDVSSTLEVTAAETFIFADRIYVKGSITGVSLADGDIAGFCILEGNGNIPTTDNDLSITPDPIQLEADGVNYNNAPGSFIGLFTDLTELTNYSIRAYVIINGVISYSDLIEVTTAPRVATDDGNGTTGEDGKKPVDSWTGEDADGDGKDDVTGEPIEDEEIVFN